MCSRRIKNIIGGVLLVGLVMLCSAHAAVAQLSNAQAFQVTLTQAPGLRTHLPTASQQHVPASGTAIAPGVVLLHWKIAPGYHLYRERISLKPAPGSQVKLAKLILPPAHAEQIIAGKHYQFYTAELTLTVPILNRADLKAPQIIDLDYQGCYGTSYCYPPVHKHMSVDHLRATWVRANTASVATVSEQQQAATGNRFFRMLSHRHAIMVILIFLGCGILLAFTPCVLPMIPILASVIIGSKQQASFRRAFLLSLTYVMCAALTFALAGFFTALAGSSVQAALQNKYINLAMALIFVILALSLFGVYDLQLPYFLRKRLEAKYQTQSGGTYVSAAVMGVLSSLIVSPCISAPLAGALLFISTTGDTVLGFTALLAMGLGMGIPLIIIGTFGGKVILRAGPIVRVVKVVFGLLMLGLAAWMVLRAFPRNSTGVAITAGEQAYTVYNTQQLDAKLQQALQQKKPVVIDYYADWCMACKELAYKTLQDSAVKSKLRSMLLIKADVTTDNAEAKALQARYKVFAPPTLIFIKKNGEVLPSATLYGYVPAATMLESLQQISP